LFNYQSRILTYRQDFNQFDKFLTFLDANRNRPIKKEDIPRIMVFHQPGYVSRFQDIANRHEQQYQEIKNLCTEYDKSIHYNRQYLNSLNLLSEKIGILTASLAEEEEILRKDISTLSHYNHLNIKMRIENIINKFRANRQK
jgi:hypothetical protein